MPEQVNVHDETAASAPQMYPVMTSEQLRRETSYRVAIDIAQKLLMDGVITKPEVRRIEQIVGQRFSPIWGGNAPLFG